MAATFAQSESELAAGATKRKRKRRRSPGGLGRGLARILTDTQAAAEVSQPNRSGLLQLVGGESNAKADRIRRFVVDAALGTMVDGFALEGVVLAAQGPRPHDSGSIHTRTADSRTADSRTADSRTAGTRSANSQPNGSRTADRRPVERPTDDSRLFDPQLFDSGDVHSQQAKPRMEGSGQNGAGARIAGSNDLDRLPSQPRELRAAETWTAATADGAGPNPDNAAHFFGPQGGSGPNEDGGPRFLAARLSAGWPIESSVPYEVYRRLWRVLQHDFAPGESPLIGMRMPSPIPRQEQWQVAIGRRWALISRMDDGDTPVAAVAIRTASFGPEEADAFGAMVASVVAATSDDDTKTVRRQLIRAGTTATLKSEGPDLLAEVHADWDLPSSDGTAPISGRRAGVGRGSDPISAVARAAAKACRPRCEVAFAGSSEVEDVEVSIVMIRQSKQGLRLGFAVRQKGDYTGAAEAVFTAAG